MSTDPDRYCKVYAYTLTVKDGSKLRYFQGQVFHNSPPGKPVYPYTKIRILCSTFIRENNFVFHGLRVSLAGSSLRSSIGQYNQLSG